MRRVCTALAAIMGIASGCGEREGSMQRPTPWFQDEAARRGLDFSHRSGAAGEYLLPEIMGGGAALADLDGDGDLDAYLVQSGDAFPPTGNADGNVLYVNQGSGTFVAMQDSGAGDRGYGMGVIAGDYDNDGDVDLYVTNVGDNSLLRNDGGRFTDVTVQAGVGDPGFSTAAAFFDGDGDGYLDLFVVNYVAWSKGIERDCYDYGTGVLNYCDPGNYGAPSRDRLYHNKGDGTFEDVSAESGIESALGNGLGVVSEDFNGDGLYDVFVANDKTMNHFWLNLGGMRFRNDAMLWGCAMDDHGIAKAGMGVATGDVDDDGDMDLLVVNIEGETDSFYRNEGTHFVDATARFGLGTTSRRYTRFGIALADFDNDGQLDLYEANGRVTYSPEPESDDVFAETNVLFRGLATGAFAAVTPAGGVAETSIHTSRGLALGDVDGDGGLDVLVVNRDARPYLLMNRAPNRGAFVRFRLVSAQGRDAYGAKVSGMVGTARRTRTVQTAGSYLASNEPVVHFGLGKATEVGAVRVRWPSGVEEAFGDFTGGRIHVLREGGGQGD